MRALLPVPVDEVDLHAHYAAGWVDVGGVRLDFVASVDGAVSAAGLSRGLQTPGDNRVFAALRDLADVVLAGAGTVRAEGYRAVRLGERRIEARRRFGLAPLLPIAVVSASLDLDPSSPLFAPEAPRTIVITAASSDPERRRALAEVADVALVGDATVDLRAAVTELRERGLRRIVCEGGPRLFADLLRAGVVDELCLSISPLLAGPGPGRITAGEPLATLAQLDLVGLLEENSALFARYRLGPAQA